MLELMIKMIKDAGLTLSSADDCGRGYFRAMSREQIIIGGIDRPAESYPQMIIEIFTDHVSPKIFVTLNNDNNGSKRLKVIGQEFYMDVHNYKRPVAY